MDAFEEIIGKLLEEEGYWVRHSVKINLTKEEKRLIGKPSAPRPEIDIVALDIVNNRVILLEVKSYFDSNGVRIENVMAENEQQEGRYKLLTSNNYRQIIQKRLLSDWTSDKVVKNDVVIGYGLVAGNVYQGKEAELKEYMEKKKWFFWGPNDVRTRVKALERKGYENNPVTIAVKILRDAPAANNVHKQ